uniref:Nck-associated protein 5 C-terminal domain-containing protein n=1 Tax=Echeneis naucrates TaxID=173247 RepID=A0A665WGE1_ECHNA
MLNCLTLIFSLAPPFLLFREKLAVARLQREVARSKSEGTMREKLIHELEEERRLRLESEKRLREVTEESELGRAQMVSLQQQFSRMEETVRSLLQNQGVLEQTAVDTVDIMKAYKVNQHVPHVPFSFQWKEKYEENSALALENESQREQYERCLDEVANQVVQALLTQKDLREECLKLRTRVFDLEQQNRALSVLFQQRIKPASDLLLQKLHSRIMDLSAADLLLEPERSKAFLLSRNDVQLNGKAKCLSQLSLTAPPPAYPRSSCSSSELSLSSACSEFSSGSYTWNDGRSCGKMVNPLYSIKPGAHGHSIKIPVSSGCQMRTLDSGIGTFPLPDSVTRASGRHIPKSESSPDRVTAGSSELDQEPSSSHPDSPHPEVRVPSLPTSRLHAPTSMGHSLSDPTVTCGSSSQDTQSRLPKLATSGNSQMQLSKSAQPEIIKRLLLWCVLQCTTRMVAGKMQSDG